MTQSETNLIREAPKPGIYRGVPFKEYKAWLAWNPSIVKVVLNKSPRAARYALDLGREETDPMRLGTALHTAILEPRKFEADYVVYRDGIRRGKTWDAFEAAHADKVILNEKEYTDTLAMRDAVRADAVAGPLLSGPGEHELSVVWRHPQTGLLCKGRLDRLVGDTYTDPKTCSDPYPFAFKYAILKYGYHISCGAYRQGLRENGRQMTRAILPAIQSAPPYEVVCHEIDHTALNIGEDDFDWGMGIVKACLDSGIWPGFATEPVQFVVPDYAITDTADYSDLEGA